MKKFVDYYQILGISKHASSYDIKKSYREKARIHHPDAGGNAQMFKLVKEAYDVLSKSDSRKKYDILYVQEQNAKRNNSNFYSQQANQYQEMKKKEKEMAASRPYEQYEYNRYEAMEPTRPKWFIPAIIILIILLFFAGKLATGIYSHIQSVKNNSSSSSSSSGFSIGSSQSDVLYYMGTPDKKEQNVWYYGNSTVRFDDSGKVENWIDADNNLKAK